MVYISYVLLFLITLVLYFSKSKKIFAVINVCALIVIMGFRPLEIMDTHTYCRIFYEIRNCSFADLVSNYRMGKGVELGFQILMKLSSLISPYYSFFQFLVALFYCVVLITFIYKYSSNVVVGLAIFLGIGLYFQAFNIMREFLSVSICLLSWMLLRRGKLIRSILLALIATLIHRSAFMFFIIYPLFGMRGLKFVLQCIVPILLVFVIVFSKNIIEYLTNLLGVYEQYDQLPGYRVGLIAVVWGIVAIFSLFVLFNSCFSKDERLNAVFCLIYICTCLIGVKYQLVERLGLYFMPFTIPLFSTISNYMRKNDDKILWIFNIGVTMCFLALFVLTGLSEQYGNYYFYFG